METGLPFRSERLPAELDTAAIFMVPQAREAVEAAKGSDSGGRRATA
jgi:hypothetical protein